MLLTIIVIVVGYFKLTVFVEKNIIKKKNGIDVPRTRVRLKKNYTANMLRTETLSRNY